MKTLITILLILFCAFFCTAQNEKPVASLNIDEVEISPPHFTGIMNYATEIERSGLKNYLNRNVDYLESSNGCYLEGTVVVSFLVSPTGKVTEVDIINSVCDVIDNEVIRVLQTTDGMWRPGIKDGKPVTMPQEVSLVFAKADDMEDIAERFQSKASFYFTKASSHLLEKGKSRKAEKLYSKGISYMPYDKSLLLMRGLCRYELGNIEGALTDWNRLKVLGGIDMDESYFADNIRGLEGYDEVMALLNK